MAVSSALENVPAGKVEDCPDKIASRLDKAQTLPSPPLSLKFPGGVF
jgi:hypothetical protein